MAFTSGIDTGQLPGDAPVEPLPGAETEEVLTQTEGETMGDPATQLPPATVPEKPPAELYVTPDMDVPGFSGAIEDLADDMPRVSLPDPGQTRVRDGAGLPTAAIIHRSEQARPMPGIPRFEEMVQTPGRGLERAADGPRAEKSALPRPAGTPALPTVQTPHNPLAARPVPSVQSSVETPTFAALPASPAAIAQATATHARPRTAPEGAATVASPAPVLIPWAARSTPGERLRPKETEAIPAPTQTIQGPPVPRAAPPAFGLVPPVTAQADKNLTGPLEAEAEWQVLVRSEGPGSTGANPVTQALHRQELSPNVTRQIVEALQNAPGRPVEITLDPKELGRVRLALSSTERGITVHVLVERPETLDLMRRHIGSLEMAFADIGYSSIAFAFAGGGEGRKEDRPAPSAVHATATENLPASEPARIALRPGAATGIDIRL